MFPLLLAASLAVYLQYRTVVGQQAGVTFLLLLMALKLLEMRARRDIFVVIFLSFFILLTQFLNGPGNTRRRDGIAGCDRVVFCVDQRESG